MCCEQGHLHHNTIGHKQNPGMIGTQPLGHALAQLPLTRASLLLRPSFYVQPVMEAGFSLNLQ